MSGLTKFKVGIFAGHDDDTFETTGGKGVYTRLTPSGEYEEYDSNIVIAKETADRLSKYDEVEVYFPQENGRDMSLSERVNYCNNNNLDTVVFIHSNAAGSGAKGACAFYWYNSDDGKRFAEIYKEEMENRDYPLYSDGTYPCQSSGWSNFYVVRNTEMPVILTENFFFTNAEELKKYLLDGKNLAELGEVHEISVVRYLGIKPLDDVKVSEPKDSKVKSETISKDKPKKESDKRPLLENGDKGKWVKIAQEKLMELGYDLSQYGADSHFGDETEKAVHEFQKDQNIIVDGLIGKNTWAKLDSAKLAHKSNLPNETYWVKSPMFHGDGVLSVQKALSSVYYYPEKDAPDHGCDSWYGNMTADAVRRFQSTHRLKEDGMYGKNTRNALIKAMK